MAIQKTKVSKKLEEEQKHKNGERGIRRKTKKSNVDNRALIESGESDAERAERLTYERRQARKKAKKNEGLFTRVMNKIVPSSKDDVNKKYGWLMEELPYYAYPSYIEHNGYVATIVELYNRNSKNRDLTYTDVIELIPVDSYKNIEMFFLVDDSLIKGDEKTRIVQQNARAGKLVISDKQVTGSTEDKENRSLQLDQEATFDDYNHYEEFLQAKSDPVVVYRISLVIVGHDRETVENQVEVINSVLDQRYEGARWGSLGGDQLDRFTSLFKRIPHSRELNTSVGENYAGLGFAVSAGLNDAQGLPIGRDAMSLTSNTSSFDMAGTLQSQAVIAVPTRAKVPMYTRRVGGNNDDLDAPALNDQPSAASILAQYAANHVVLNGHNAHHIVLNDFDYFERGLYFRRPDDPGMFRRYDVSEVTINPVQGFGELKDVHSIYSRLIEKIVNMFDVLNNLELSDLQRSVILKVANDFYINNRLWTHDADRYPSNTSIVNIKSPEHLPTLPNMLTNFKTMAAAALADNRENKADTIDSLHSILKQSIDSNMAIFGRPTQITPASERQVYYDFSTIASDNIKQVQFLNMIEYIIWTASEGDVIVLHGMDNLWSKVATMAHPAIKAAQKKGIRFIFAFDTITNNSKDEIIKTDVFDLQHVYYKDLDTDVDWSMIGTCFDYEVDAYERALATELSTTIRNELMRKARCKVLIHRRSGDINTFVHASAYI